MKEHLITACRIVLNRPGRAAGRQSPAAFARNAFGQLFDDADIETHRADDSASSDNCTFVLQVRGRSDIMVPSIAWRPGARSCEPQCGKGELPAAGQRKNIMDFSLAPRKNEMIDALCTLLSIKSVKDEPHEMMPYGKGVFSVLMKALEMADHLGFDSVNLYSHLGYVDYGEGDETVVVLTHLDVMPAGEGWTVPPFEGTVRDGRVYGRGAIDNKGPAVAALYALSALQENGVNLKRRIRLLFGCDEESGWSDIAYYKERVGQIPEYGISPDAEFPIINSEKGLVQLAISMTPPSDETEAPRGAPEIISFDAGERVNVVPAKAECVLRGPCGAIEKLANLFGSDPRTPVEIASAPGVEDGTIRLTVFGKSAHGSKPEDGVNAASYLIKFLCTMPLANNGPAKFLKLLNKNVGTQTNGAAMHIDRIDRSGALTCNMGYVHASAEKLETGLDIRYPITSAESFVVDKVKGCFDDCSVKTVFALPSHYVEEDGFLVQSLKEVYEEMTGEKAYCLSVGGATYARTFPNCVAFGPLFPGQTGTEHQPDEYIEIDSFVKLADILAAAMIKLGGGTSVSA